MRHVGSGADPAASAACRECEHRGLLAGWLAKLRADADLDTTVSLLRILDVVVWMRHHNSHLPHRCAGLGG
jgi:Family of unknown function (DUF6308)